MGSIKRKANERVTQDDSRENKQIKIFGLKRRGSGRSNKYVPDVCTVVSGKEYSLELKSCDKRIGQISTSRDFGIDKVEQWRENDGFLFGLWEMKGGEEEFLEHVFCTYEQLQPFFQDVIERQRKGVKDRAGLSEWAEARIVLSEKLSPEKLGRLERTFRKGTKLNDPRMSWKNVKEWGTTLDSNDLEAHLRRLLKEKDNG